MVNKVNMSANPEPGVKVDDPLETKHGMSYLEMKYNLMIHYCQFLAFYILLKLRGRKVEGHPVIGKLLHIKTLFEKLRPLD